MKKHILKYAEFYITNVCNLSCSECNRFNNLSFSGHFKWESYKKEYTEWAKKIIIYNCGIVGGEPFLNPDIKNWIVGLAELWPDTVINLLTNGTKIDRFPDLYDLMKQYPGRIVVVAAVHETAEWDTMKNSFLSWLDQPYIPLFVYDTIKWKYDYIQAMPPGAPRCENPLMFNSLDDAQQQEILSFGMDPKDYILDKNYVKNFWIDKNGVAVQINLVDKFYKSALSISNNKLHFFDNDPDLAMEACAFKPCPHFFEGKLHKCGPVGLFSKFSQQFEMNISESDRVLMDSYRPAEHSWSESEINDFLDNQKNAVSIPQCKFCPTKSDRKMTVPDPNKKKPKFIKINVGNR